MRIKREINFDASLFAKTNGESSLRESSSKFRSIPKINFVYFNWINR